MFLLGKKITPTILSLTNILLCIIPCIIATHPAPPISLLPHFVPVLSEFYSFLPETRKLRKGGGEGKLDDHRKQIMRLRFLPGASCSYREGRRLAFFDLFSPVTLTAPCPPEPLFLLL